MMNQHLRKILTFVFTLLVGGVVFAKTPVFHYVVIKTDKGTCLLKLYNETPKHRDNFVKLVDSGYYDSLLFHRVIHNFMVQGGDPDSRYAAEKQALGNGGPDYTIPAEMQEGLIHKKGTIGAARDDNPAKQSSGSQFYFVQGRVFSNAALDSLEQFRLKGKKLSDAQRKAYTTVGGTPHLDGNYTVFGELMNGVETIDNIAAVKTDEKDRPIRDLRMSMKLLTRREALNLEREAAGLPAKTGVLTRFFDLFSSKRY
ncbi:peptidylprolyl isomerase [Sphingobacterium deserti]|uniref:Peptidyl-prolyl cis-trans isomerase n=1 Tax=Sphingobacterium deserti TaxID=1229276 RepID=A0A0B8T9V9_9SPHI|nr:peptidylprolyl isomerase [Sphingobacterium deserti]KGE14825.1 peptidyl-prolyl cis-trans isomerase cyclophilin type [Sphingobacterium deserti]